MTKPAEPPKAARRLLERILPPDDRGDAMRGDLLEEFRRDRRSPWWYWTQALSIALRYMRARRRGGRQMWLESTWQDAKYAARTYAKAPTFTVAALTTLALGIGASTAIFSVVHGVLLRPLPFPHPDRLVFIEETNGSGMRMSVSWPNFLDWQARVHTFQGLAASRSDTFIRTDLAPAERLLGRHVTANFFRVLGVRPLLGRDLNEDDDRRGATPVVMVTYEYWRRALGASGDVVGTTIQLDGRPYVVVGVLPAEFKYVQAYDVFVPMGPIQGLLYIHERGDHAGYYAVGRLKDGLSLDAAAAELSTIAADLRREHPPTNTDVGVSVQPLLGRLIADVRLTLLVLFAAVGLLLLIACANVANLLIARGTARRHEFVVRAALGGPRRRIVRQLLVESTLLCTAGGASGVLFATALLRVLVAAAPAGTPRMDEVTIDRTALLFAIGAATICGLLFGLLPAFHAAAFGGPEVMCIRAGGRSARTHGVRRVLMAVEVALAVILLTGAGLMARTLAGLLHVDTGFRPDHVLTLRTSFHGPTWNHDRRVSALAAVINHVTALPGVVTAATVSALPIDGSDWNSIFIAGDKPVPSRREMPSAAFTIISSAYFDAIGTPLLAGRLFSDADADAAARVVIVNRSLAQRIWPNDTPIGKRLKQGWPESPMPWREVVGVVGDVKFEGVAEPTPMQIYMPLAQERASDFALVVRTNGPPLALRGPIESAIHAAAPELPLFRVRTMDDVIGDSIARERMSSLVLALFAFVAVALAAIGLYGLIAQSVTERTHELGVRLALGAARAQILSLVIRQGLGMAAVGCGTGIIASLGVTQWIKQLLFGVPPSDPVTLSAVTGLSLIVAAAACALPAWRASRIDPTHALRAE